MDNLKEDAVSRPQHPIFIKYSREWLYEVTGYSTGYLSRVATGKVPLTSSFIERICYRLNQPEGNLFSPNSAHPGQGVTQQYLDACIKRTQEQIQSLLDRAEEAQKELDHISKLLLPGWITAREDLVKTSKKLRQQEGAGS